MAVSIEDIGILYDAAAIIVKIKSGQTPTDKEQEKLGDGFKFFLFLVQNYDILSDYQDLATYLTNRSLDEFIKSVTPSNLRDIAEKVEKQFNDIEKEKTRRWLFLLNLIKLAKVKKWKEFTDEEKNLFQQYTNQERRLSAYDAYQEIRKYAGLPPDREEKKEKEEEYIDITKEIREEKALSSEKPKEEEITAGKVELSLLAANIAAMADQEALIAEIKQKYKDQTEQDLNRLIRIAVRTTQLRLIAEYAKNATPEVLARIQILNQEINPKPQESVSNDIKTVSQQLVATAASISDVSFSKDQIEIAVDHCTSLIIANEKPLTETIRTEVAEIVQISLAATGNREYQTTNPIANLYTEFNQSITENLATLNQAGSLVVPFGQLVLNKDLVISLPSVEKITPLKSAANINAILGAKIPLILIDRIEKSTVKLPKLIDRTTLNPNTSIIISEISQSITQKQVDTFVRAVNATSALSDTFIRAFPTQTAEQATAVAALQPGNSTDPKTIPLYSMGLTASALAQIYQHAQANPDSPIAKVVNDPANKSFFHSLTQSISVLSNVQNQIGADLNRDITRVAGGPSYQVQPSAGIFQSFGRSFQTVTNRLTSFVPPGVAGGPSYQVQPSAGIFQSFGRSFQTVTNRLTSFVPPGVGRVMNVALHPAQFVQDRIGKFMADRLTSKVKGWIAGQVAKKVGVEVAKKLIEQGAKLLIKEGLKKAIQGLLVGTGVGALATPLVEAAFWLGEQVFGFAAKSIGKVINGISGMFTREDFNPAALGSSLFAAPFAVVGAVGGIIGGLASATAVAASTATIVLIGSTFVGFILYVTVIGVAPIIASIAQLESGIGVQQGILPSLRYPTFTGAILPGCPNTWPVPPGSFILQGPHGTFSHRTIEAIDIFVPVGSAITSITAGVVTKTGWGNAYGNWIWIDSTTESGKSFSVIYAHLTEIGVVVGDRVGEGSPIALSGATSSVPAYRNPHLHLEYRGIAYNSCPAGGVQIPEGCAGYRSSAPGSCQINRQPIYTN